MARHDFEPTAYHHTFGSHDPVLRVRSGDVVATSTVDAAGFDRDDARRIEAGNPLTGPFFVEGADPGDVLLVRIEVVRPNRRRGFSSVRLAPNVVDPDYVPELAVEDPRFRRDWEVDVAGGTARVLGVPDLAATRFPLAQMLGCIGVAPARGQAISTATSDRHGGNMDYRRIGPGVTLHLPVFVPGALLFVGDAHALQGAGEMTGTGVEISADVTFSVEVAKGHPIGWPRGERDGVIFTVGNARPLDQATQHATTEMMRWLRHGFGYGVEAASILIGQSAEYELGNMFDPAYTMVCSLERELVDRST